MSLSEKNSTAFAALVALVLLPVPALAHIMTGESGFQSGFTHPLFGLDHLLAMLAVGLWGAQMGGRNVWTLPVAFPLVMTLGGIAGMAGITVPHVEWGIAISVLTLGAVIALAWRAPEPVALALIAFFAVCHGYAHGVELPKTAQPAPYAIGFVMATGLIHVVGIGVGLLSGKLWHGRLTRALGLLIALGGVYFLWLQFSGQKP